MFRPSWPCSWSWFSSWSRSGGPRRLAWLTREPWDRGHTRYTEAGPPCPSARSRSRWWSSWCRPPPASSPPGSRWTWWAPAWQGAWQSELEEGRTRTGGWCQTPSEIRWGTSGWRLRMTPKILRRMRMIWTCIWRGARPQGTWSPRVPSWHSGPGGPGDGPSWPRWWRCWQSLTGRESPGGNRTGPRCWLWTWCWLCWHWPGDASSHVWYVYIASLRSSSGHFHQAGSDPELTGRDRRAVITIRWWHHNNNHWHDRSCGSDNGSLTSVMPSDDQTKHFQLLSHLLIVLRIIALSWWQERCLFSTKPKLVTGSFKCHCFNIYCGVLLVFLIQDKRGLVIKILPLLLKLKLRRGTERERGMSFVVICRDLDNLFPAQEIPVTINFLRN